MAEEKQAKEAKKQSFKVTKEFVLDKSYKIGNSIELSDKKIIETLTSNKFIK